MSGGGTFSPSRMNGGGGPMETGAFLYGSSPPEDISLRMKVPKRIKANGEVDDDLPEGLNGYSSWEQPKKLSMNVPDRIMLAGQDQHIGTRAPPREIVLENSVLGNALTMTDVRVNTPPRIITLDQHCFPSAADEDDQPESSSPPPSPQSPKMAQRRPAPISATPVSRHVDSRIMFRETTPPIEGLTAAEEVVHLRRQVARINRRVMAIELDALQRQQRERIAYAVGIAYFIYKVIAWLNRS